MADSTQETNQQKAKLPPPQQGVTMPDRVYETQQQQGGGGRVK